MTLGKAVQAWMVWRHFTVQQLAVAADVKYHTIYRLIKGKHVNISVGDAVKLARALGTTVEVLVDGPLPPVLVEDAIQRVTALLAPPE